MTNYSTHSASFNKEASARKTYIFTKYEFYKTSNIRGTRGKFYGMHKIKNVGTDATLDVPIIKS